MLGIYLSGHPLEKLKHQIELQTNINTKELALIDSQMANVEEQDLEDPEALLNMASQIQSSKNIKYKDGQEVRYVGIITKIKKKYTKTNKIMAFVTIEDLYGTAEILAFENTYLKSQSSLMEENIVLVKGRLSIRDGEKTTIIANEINDFNEKRSKVLSLDITGGTEETKIKLRGAIKYFNGEMNNIKVQIIDGEKIMPCGAIYCTEEIFNVFVEILGIEKTKIEDI